DHGTETVALLGEERIIGLFRSYLAPDAGAGDDGGSSTQLRRPHQPGLADRLASGDQRKLGESVEQVQLLGLEVGERIVPPNLCDVLEAQSRCHLGIERPDSRAALHQPVPESGRIVAQVRDDPESRDHDASSVHSLTSTKDSAWFHSPLSLFSTVSTILRASRSNTACSLGISIEN